MWYVVLSDPVLILSSPVSAEEARFKTKRGTRMRHETKSIKQKVQDPPVSYRDLTRKKKQLLYIRLKYISFEIHGHDLERNFVQ